MNLFNLNFYSKYYLVMVIYQSTNLLGHQHSFVYLKMNFFFHFQKIFSIINYLFVEDLVVSLYIFVMLNSIIGVNDLTLISNCIFICLKVYLRNYLLITKNFLLEESMMLGLLKRIILMI